MFIATLNCKQNKRNNAMSILNTYSEQGKARERELFLLLLLFIYVFFLRKRIDR